MFLRRTPQFLLFAVLCCTMSVAQQKPASKRAIATTAAPAPTITLAVDATEAPRKIFHAHMTIPAAPGPLTLLYPKWIPGEHGPTGPVVDTAGLKFTAGGQTIPWTRDGVDMYAYHLAVPPGATSVDVQMDYLSPVETGGFSAGSSATAQMAVISWNWLVLYPKGFNSDAIQVKSSLKL